MEAEAEAERSALALVMMGALMTTVDAAVSEPFAIGLPYLNLLVVQRLKKQEYLGQSAWYLSCEM